MKLFKTPFRLHFPWSKPSLKSRIIWVLTILGIIHLLIYSVFTIPTRIARISTPVRVNRSSCQNNIKSIILSDQCGEKSFRSATVECLIPSSTNLSNQLSPDSCYTIDYLYSLAKKSCSSCVVPVNAVPKLSFVPSELKASIGTTFTVALQIDTAGQAASGVGAKIIFDPAYLQGVSIDQGTTFPNYSTTTIDNTTGRMIISAITSSYYDTFTGVDTFASVTFKVIKNGPTTVKFDFVPGSTTDSNIAVTTGNGDILSAVNSLKISPATRK